MSLSEPSPRRCVPIRLCDLPEPVRLRGARQACAAEPDPDEQLGILTAALIPSDRTYWVASFAEDVRECAHCGGFFVGFRGTARYCSPRCQRAAYVARRSKRDAA